MGKKRLLAPVTPVATSACFHRAKQNCIIIIKIIMFIINYSPVHRTITEQLLVSQTFIIAFL